MLRNTKPIIAIPNQNLTENGHQYGGEGSWKWTLQNNQKKFKI